MACIISDVLSALHTQTRGGLLKPEYQHIGILEYQTKKNIRKLQLVQNYASKIATGLKKYDHISEALKSLKWLNTKDKLPFNVLGMVDECTNNLTPDYLRERFQLHSEIHQGPDTRQKSDLAFPKYTLVTGKGAFAFCGENFL